MENVAHINGRSGRMEGAQEKVMTLGPLRDREAHLIKLYQDHQDAGSYFSEAIKAVAEMCGLNAKNVRARITAKARDRFNEAQRDARQRSFLFDEE